jgi:cell wall-associated NlpC family hydrolase
MLKPTGGITLRQIIVFLTLALMLFTGAGVSSATVEKPAFLHFGERFLWTPYELGANRFFQWDHTFNPTFTGYTFDCSSFTQYVSYMGLGVTIAGDSRSQARDNGYYISKEHLRMGDLVFFTSPSRAHFAVGNLERVGHVGFFAGYGEIQYGKFVAGGASARPVMLHSSQSAGVRYSYIDTPYWQNTYIASKRIVSW